MYGIAAEIFYLPTQTAFAMAASRSVKRDMSEGSPAAHSML